MKKIFLVALAAIGMTACMQDEVVEIANGGAITFDNAFVGNATRAASVTKGTLTAFNVWGYVDNPTGVVFNGTEVRGGNDVWNYEGTQYWMPNNEYWFAAVAPVKENWILEMETATTTRTLTFANDCVTDLVYASKYVEADDNYDPVEFTFAHLLSKIQFTVTTNLPDYSEATVDNLQIVTVKDATIDLLESPMQWEPTTTETFQLNFNDDYFIVPAACEVSFDVTLKAVNSTNNGYTVTKTATLPADAFEMGHAYNLCAEINPATLALEEIEFTANVTDWKEVPNASDDAANLLYAAQFGGEVTLEKDIVLTSNLIVTANTTINLNNHSIKGGKPDSAEMTGTDIAAITVDGGALTIVGEGAVEGTEYGVYVKNGSVTIKDGEFKAGTSAVQVYNGTANIEGGKFSATSTNVYVVNCIDANWKNGTAKVNITGGTFVGFNPADNAAEGAGTNFVAEGYISVLGENGYTVVKGASVTSVDEFNAALTNPENEVVVVDTDLDYGTNGLSFERDVVVNFNNNDLVAGGKTTKNSSFSVFGEYDVEVKNANITGGSIMTYYGANVVLDNVSLTYNFAQSGRNMIYAASDNDKQVVVTVNGGNYTMTGGSGNRYVCAHGNAIVYIKAGTFTGKPAGSTYSPIEEIAIGSYTPQVIISGGTFNFDPSEWVADGYVAVKDGSYWTVVAE